MRATIAARTAARWDGLWVVALALLALLAGSRAEVTITETTLVSFPQLVTWTKESTKVERKTVRVTSTRTVTRRITSRETKVSESVSTVFATRTATSTLLQVTERVESAKRTQERTTTVTATKTEQIPIILTATAVSLAFIERTFNQLVPVTVVLTASPAPPQTITIVPSIVPSPAATRPQLATPTDPILTKVITEGTSGFPPITAVPENGLSF